MTQGPNQPTFAATKIQQRLWCATRHRLDDGLIRYQSTALDLRCAHGRGPWRRILVPAFHDPCIAESDIGGCIVLHSFLGYNPRENLVRYNLWSNKISRQIQSIPRATMIRILVLLIVLVIAGAAGFSW